MKPSVIWNYSMYKRVLDEYPTKGTALAKELGTTVAALNSVAVKLGVTHASKFSDEEMEIVRRHGRKLKDALVFLLPNRTVSEVHKVLCEMHYV